MIGRWIVSLAAVCALAGCAFKPASEEPARYGLPDPAVGGSSFLRAVTVQGPSWLAGPDMVYRLAYQDGERRRVFALSRWHASPMEMLERYLARSLTGQGTGGSCRLRVDVDQFLQEFERPDSSHGVIEVRLTLLGKSGGTLLGRHSLRVTRPTVSADAGGGAAALGLAAGDLSQAIGRWLDKLNLGNACS